MPRHDKDLRLVAVLLLATLICVAAVAPLAPLAIVVLLSALLTLPVSARAIVRRLADDRLAPSSMVFSPLGLRAPPQRLVSVEIESRSSGGQEWLNEVGWQRC